jgi:hypothetical protein
MHLIIAVFSASGQLKSCRLQVLVASRSSQVWLSSMADIHQRGSDVGFIPVAFCAAVALVQ